MLDRLQTELLDGQQVKSVCVVKELICVVSESVVGEHRRVVVGEGAGHAVAQKNGQWLRKTYESLLFGEQRI